MAPPIAWTRSISARAPSTSSATFASITGEPSKMSSYSRRSDSNASTCWRRSDHCWSHGRGRQSASFHAGSWTARALLPDPPEGAPLSHRLDQAHACVDQARDAPDDLLEVLL